MKPIKFTFKTEHPTGRYRAFNCCYHYIKLKKKQVGSISDESPHEIRLMVIKLDIMEDGNPNCTWKWITLKNKFTSLDEAKKFLNINFTSINERWKLAEID